VGRDEPDAMFFAAGAGPADRCHMRGHRSFVAVWRS
jgi:hypothetical protein